MQWAEVRAVYPDQWLIIEALEAHTDNRRRLLDKIAVVERCPDGATAMQHYRKLHQHFPLREFYFVHTSRDELEIEERHWAGIRRNDAPAAQR
jgi:hypothetical protein